MSRDPLIDAASRTFDDDEIVRLIKTSQMVVDIASEVPGAKNVSKDLIDELKNYYSGADFRTAVFLWHDNYNSLMIMSKRQQEENYCSYLVRHKVIALGLILSELL